MDHDRTAGALRKSNFKRSTVGAASGDQSIREEIGSVNRERMNAEEVDKLRDVVGAEWLVSDFLAARADNDGMKFVVFADAVHDQACPVDGHGIGGLRARHNPEGGLVGKIPAKDRALVGVALPKFGGEIGFETQHLGISVRMPPMPPGNIPVRFANFAANKQAGVKIYLVFVSQ